MIERPKSYPVPDRLPPEASNPTDIWMPSFNHEPSYVITAGPTIDAVRAAYDRHRTIDLSIATYTMDGFNDEDLIATDVYSVEVVAVHEPIENGHQEFRFMVRIKLSPKEPETLLWVWQYVDDVTGGLGDAERLLTEEDSTPHWGDLGAKQQARIIKAFGGVQYLWVEADFVE